MTFRRQKAKLDTLVHTRYEMQPDGDVVEGHRDDPKLLYGLPYIETAYIWQESTRRAVVALRADVRNIGGREYGCFYALPTLDAAIMFARAVTP